MGGAEAHKTHSYSQGISEPSATARTRGLRLMVAKMRPIRGPQPPSASGRRCPWLAFDKVTSAAFDACISPHYAMPEYPCITQCLNILASRLSRTQRNDPYRNHRGRMRGRSTSWSVTLWSQCRMGSYRRTYSRVCRYPAANGHGMAELGFHTHVSKMDNILHYVESRLVRLCSASGALYAWERYLADAFRMTALVMRQPAPQRLQPVHGSIGALADSRHQNAWVEV